MALIDQRGRLFGRLNLVDAALVALLCGAIPLAYGAWALFRTPAPKLTAIVPATLPFGANVHVTVKGDNLRPYMRVSFNDVQGVNFLFSSTAAAEVQLPSLPPGTYDVVLYDYAQEQSRLKKALVITPPALPTTSVEIVGALTNLPSRVAQSIDAAFKLTGYGELTAVGKPHAGTAQVSVGEGSVWIPVADAEEVPLVLRAPCSVQMLEGKPVCVAAGPGIPLRPEAFLTLSTSVGDWPFQIHQVRSPVPLVPVDVDVRLTGAPIVLEAIRVGDTDLGLHRNELAAGAKVTAVSPVRRLTDAMGEPSGSVVVTLRLSAQRDAVGAWYAGDGLRPGGAFVLVTPGYQAKGTVERLAPVKPGDAPR